MVGSGPKSLALAAELADRVTMAVGADPGRIEWGLGQVRAAARAAGRDPDAIPVGAYVNVSVDDDKEAARRTARGFTATFAHFSASVGADFDNQPEILRNVTEKLVTDYDTNHHSQADAPHTELLDADFIEWFAAVGNADKVIRRLAPLVELGLDHLYFVGPWTGLAEEVMPALRRMRA